MSILDFAEFRLREPYNAGDATIKIKATDAKYALKDQKTNTDITDFTLTVVQRKQIGDTDSSLSKIKIRISGIATQGVDNGFATYDLTVALADDGTTKMYGLANSDNGTNEVANVIVGNSLATLETNSPCYVAVSGSVIRSLEATYTSTSSTVALFVAGEAISERDAVSIHTDDKIYKYHKTNYPNLVGISNADYAVDETVTYIAEGGAKTGFTGLTPNELVYAENTGAVTQTSSATTSILGRADSATQVRVKLPAGDLVAASQSEIDAGVGTGIPNVTQSVELIDNTTGYSGEFLQAVTASTPISVYGFATDGDSTATESINESRIGYSTSLEKVAYPIFGNGTDFTTIDIKLKKVGVPTDDIEIRIEGDSSGVPDGIAEVGYTSSIAAASVVDGINTFTLGATANFTNKRWLVIQKAGSVSTSSYYTLYTQDNIRFSQAANYQSSAWTILDETRQPYVSCSGIKSKGLFKCDYLTINSGSVTGNFVGFPKATYSAGETGILKTSGNVFGGLSGLNPSSLYGIERGTSNLEIYNSSISSGQTNIDGYLVALDETTLMYK